jgi:copper chaperone CopZ
MKKLFAIFMTVMLLNMSPAFAEHADNLQHDVVIKVDGMVCDFCAQSIKKVFSKQESVEGVAVDLDKGEIIVDLKDGQTLDDDVMKGLVVDAGYTVREIMHGDVMAVEK